MNTRCHYCGWSFSLSRDALEAAVSVALAANEKMHMEHCPRCRRVIKLPVAQLRRALPANWSPAEAPAAPAEPEPVAEVTAPEVAETPEATADKPKRRRRGAAAATSTAADEATQPPNKAAVTKPPSGKTAAKAPAAKKTARKQSKP